MSLDFLDFEMPLLRYYLLRMLPDNSNMRGEL